MYAIVDIETTGGFAGRSKITEIAIFIHDGEKVIDHYETLIDPEQHIPNYITGLTGISNATVEKAPTFKDVAAIIHEKLDGNIFVAHNVHFDYSFVKAALEENGYEIGSKKLCTVRLTRGIFPGLRSYGLGNICEHFNIKIIDRHRAGGDARATAVLFGQLLKENPEFVQIALHRSSKETTLPPHLPKEEFHTLPEAPGVYYFVDGRNEVIYVGKAINIKKRIRSHFSGRSKDPRNQYIRNEVHHIQYELTGNELLALVLESQEIKRLWPKYNRSQKYVNNQWTIYSYEDRQGYWRLNVSKVVKGNKGLSLFNNHADAWHFLIDKVKEHELCPKLCGIQKSINACFDYADGNCKGACISEEDIKDYNSRVQALMDSLNHTKESYAIVGAGRYEDETAVILLEEGKYKGFGFCDSRYRLNSLDDAKSIIEPQQGTVEIERYLESHMNSSESLVVNLEL
ncbi:MAG: exonuclease domain-containing protein [Bacteroidota bacterium]